MIQYNVMNYFLLIIYAYILFPSLIVMLFLKFNYSWLWPPQAVINFQDLIYKVNIILFYSFFSDRRQVHVDRQSTPSIRRK